MIKGVSIFKKNSNGKTYDSQNQSLLEKQEEFKKSIWKNIRREYWLKKEALRTKKERQWKKYNDLMCNGTLISKMF